MSTIWEMASIVRSEEERASRNRSRRETVVDIVEPGRLEFWCRHFGTTPMNLYCAIDAVGCATGAVRRHLEKRGRARIAVAT